MGRNVPGPDDGKAPQAPKDCQTPNGFARAKHVADVGSKREMLKKAARYQLLVDFGTTARVNCRTDGEGPGTCPSDLGS
jgi:hypothetical protein